MRERIKWSSRRLQSGLLLLLTVMPLPALALEAPTGVDWVSTSENSVTFSWNNSEPDARVEFQFQRDGGAWSDLPGSTKAGVSSTRWSPVISGDRFRLRTVELDAGGSVIDSSDYTEAIEITIRSDLKISGVKCVIQSPGDFNYPLSLQGFNLQNISLTGLPDTLTLEADPDRIAGHIASGAYSAEIIGTIGKHRRTVRLELIISEPPVVQLPIDEMRVGSADASNHVVDLNNTFADPDTETVVRMNTVLGDVDIALSDSVSPNAVAAFMKLLEEGEMDGTFFHNVASTSFSIIQGGQFSGRDDGKIQRITADPLDPSTFDATKSNVCGTISMLKPTETNRTTQWLFNFDDNSETLDSFYGAFGRIMGSGMSIIQSMAELPVTSDYIVTIVTCEGSPPEETCSENSQRFENWPLLRIREDGLDTEDLVTLSKVSQISPLAFAVESNSSPAVASVVISDSGELTVDFLSQGQTTIAVVATDRDGASTSYSFTASVGASFGSWASAAGLSGEQAALTANPDGDEFSNLLEYAFGGSPLIKDSAAIGISTANQGSFEERQAPSITFYYRGDAVDLNYEVQITDDFSGEWSSIWTSQQGLDDPSVLTNEDAGGGMRRVTIIAKDASLPAYLRVQVTAT